MKLSLSSRLLLAAFASAPWVCAAPTERVPDYETALIRAKATGNDIAILQYGSDWNPASLAIHDGAWAKDALPAALGDGFILLAADYPEVAGGRAVYGVCTEKNCGLTGLSDTAIGSAPPLRLEAVAKTEPPACEIVSVTSEAGVAFSRRADGAYLAKTDPNPAQDTIVLRMKTGRTGSLLRLDFPPDASLPAGGPGRAGNGNAAITEVEVLRDGARLTPGFAWSDANMGGTQGPWVVVDGVSDKPDLSWNFATHAQHVRRTLLVALKESIPAGANLTVRLVCKSPWGQHTPGCVRAAVLADAATIADVRAVGRAQVTQYRNRGYTWTGWGKMPRLALLDREGRPVAADPGPRASITSAEIAAELKAMRAKREKRDALWAKAANATGPAKAELLRQGLDAFDIGRDPEFGRNNGWGGGAGQPFESVQKAMREADPKDVSGAIRWLGFSEGAWGGVAWAKDNEWWKKLEGKAEPTEADYAAAEACIDRELADPRNRLLGHDHIQHIMKARYDLYMRKLKNDRLNPKIFEIQREIAKVDPDTFWGVGAIGYIGMFKRGDNPFLCYGFDGNHQLKSGENAWVLADSWMQVDHAGAYKFLINYAGGKDTLKIRRIAVLDGEKEIASGTPDLGEAVLAATNRTVVVPFEIKSLRDGANPLLRIEYAAASGKLDITGGFVVEPLLIDE